MYTLTFFGKTKEISRIQFFSVLIFFLVTFASSVIGLYQISGWLLLCVGALSLSVKLNDVRYALLPNTIQGYIGQAALILGFTYFWYNLWT